jgi:tripartite ATP-independent transporter DctM subunit
MPWWLVLAIVVGGLLTLMFLRVPVAWAFFTVNIVAAWFILGGTDGLEQLVASTRRTLANFALAAVPPFILMGELVFLSGAGPRMISALDVWFRRVRARLSLLAVGGGTVLSTLTGTSIASTAMLGSTLLPEMQKRGYSPQLSAGPILGSGGLAVMIPPTALGVLLATIARISVGDFLLGIIGPGILVALLLAAYVVIRSRLQPHLVPQLEAPAVPFGDKLYLTARYVLPAGIVVFFVVGTMVLGIATPTEAASMGVIGALIVAALSGTLTIRVVARSLAATAQISAMMLIVIAGSGAFSQILSFSGVTRELVGLVGALEVNRYVILAVMLLIVLVMGTFMEGLSILLITIPVFMPIVQTLGFDPIWFAILLLINIEAGLISPPFGISLFALRAVAPDLPMRQIYASALPLVALFITAMVIVAAVPQIALWLPSVTAR